MNSAEQEDRFRPGVKCPRAGRLVVRNLPFKITETQLKDHFSAFGELEEVHFLKKNQTFTGCAFVQFKNKFSAGIALAKTSGREFEGRTIIVDWAVSKDRFQANNRKTDVENVEVKVENEDEKPNVEELDGIIEKSLVDSSEKEETDDDDEEDENDSHLQEIPDEKPKIKSEKFLELKRRHLEEDQLNVRTLFVSNVPFLAQNKDLLKAAGVAGKVSYALVVIDPLTEHSRGSGFIRYESAEVADKVLSGQVKLSINGIELQVRRAKSKTQITGEKEEGNAKCAKDNRNLYLAKEGVVLAGSSAAEGLTDGDMNKRLRLEQWKTSVLRNLHMFISPNRLVVHNIPSHYDDKTLFNLFKTNSPKGAVITEARIMKTINDKEIGRSKGYGFVTFKSHDDALTALRNINNNPSLFSPTRRPIVAFSVENRKALNIKEKRRQMSEQNAQSNYPSKLDSSDRPNKRKNSSEGPKGASTKRPRTSSAVAPAYAGTASKFGSKKLMTKKQIILQAQKHRQITKKTKKLNKLSRTQKRKRRSKNSIL